VIEDNVFVPPEVPLVPDTPWHPMPARVKARVEIVRAEESKKRRRGFIYSLLYGY
jgi:hypothetical protein